MGWPSPPPIHVLPIAPRQPSTLYPRVRCFLLLVGSVARKRKNPLTERRFVEQGPAGTVWEASMH